MIFVGIDWGEAHHDAAVMDESGRVIARERVDDGLHGVRRLHALIGDQTDDADQVIVGIETDRGLLVNALVAAGYQVYAVNPRAADRYRDRYALSGAKSDRGDAKILADMVRTDRHNLRQVAGDTPAVEAVKALARSHQSLIWARQRQVNQLRHALREYYPGAIAAFGGDLADRDALAVPTIAPTPEAGGRLSTRQIAAALRRGGRQRHVDTRAAVIRDRLRAAQLAAPREVADSYSAIASAQLAVITTMTRQIAELEAALATRFEQHPDAEILRSLPGLGVVLGARVLGEFGDDPDRYVNAKARRNYAGSSPITRRSGSRRVVLARSVRNRRLADALALWAFCSLTASPGARAFYDRHRSNGDGHHQALRALANRWVSILHGCLRHRTCYDENIAWPTATTTDSAAA